MLYRLPFSPTVETLVIAAVERIIGIERERGEISRTDRAALAPEVAAVLRPDRPTALHHGRPDWRRSARLGRSVRADALTSADGRHDRKVVNGKPAIEWIMERYQVTRDKDSGIVNDPNDWSKELDQPRYIIDLLQRIIRVSLETMKFVATLPPLNEQTSPEPAKSGEGPIPANTNSGSGAKT